MDERKTNLTDADVLNITDYLRSTGQLMPILSKGIKSRTITDELLSALDSLELRRTNLMNMLKGEQYGTEESNDEESNDEESPRKKKRG